MVQSEKDEKFAGTYRKLFDTIERGVEQCSTDRLQTLLEEKKEYLKLGLEAFGEPSTQARAKFTSGPSVTVEGKAIKLEQHEKDLIYKLSDTINLNELQCASLWEAYRQENKEYVARLNNKEQSGGQQQPALNENVELLMNIVSFYFEDRISLLECIGSLQRIAIDQDHPYSAIASDTLDKIIDGGSTIPLYQRLFTQYSTLVHSNVPNRTYSFPGWAGVWAKQNIKEQKALLEIIFLFSLTNPFTPKFILSIIREFEADCFGVIQASGYALDDEGIQLREKVTYIATLIAIHIIVLPDLTMHSKLTANGTTLLDTPDIITKINQIVLHMGDRKEHGVFLLGWAYFITCLDNALYSNESIPVPENYKQVALLLEGKQEISPASVLMKRPTTNNGTEFQEERQVTIKQTTQMDRILLGRSLKLQVFDVMTDILSSEICNEEDVNNMGYRSVFRTVFKAFLSTTRPHYIPQQIYASLVKSYCLVYQGQEGLCDSFWNQDYNKEDTNSLLATARGRFPVFFQDLIQLLSALSGAPAGGKKGGAEGEKTAAEHVYEYLSQMPTITIELANDVRMTAINENGSVVIQADQTIRVTQEIQTIASIEIPEGSRGVLLSPPESPPVVQFTLSYSGWHLLTSVLAAFMNYSGSNIDVKDEDDHLKGRNIGTVDTILDLIYNVLNNNPKLVTTLVQHIEAVARIPGQSTSTPVIIDVLCNILSSCSAVQPYPIPTMTTTLKCLTLLIPYYRNDIWLYLQTAPILPRPDASIPVSTRLSSAMVSNPAAQIQQIVARIECVTGRYTLLLAFLDMVLGLVRDVQRNWWVMNDNTSMPNRQYQVEVLYLCLHYFMLNVFPSYAHWRYKKLSERFLIGTKVLSIFIEITRDFKEPVALTATGAALTLNSIREGIFNNFLYEGGVYHINPLLETISEGANFANNLYKINHSKEAERIEKLTEMTFSFVKILLQHRLEQISQNTTAVYSSTLEHLLLERTNSMNSSSDFLLRIVRHINYRHNIALQIEATNVLCLLCRTTANWKTVPNFVQYLGNTDQVHQIIRTYLEISKDHFQSEVLLSCIWRLMTAFMETQPSLAILFLDCGDLIMPSPKSAVRLLPSQQTGSTSGSITVAAAPPPPAPSTTESAVRAAIDILAHWETLSVQKPTVASNVLHFLATFWQTAFDHYALVERTRSDNALWDVLGKILLNPSGELDITGAHLQKMDLLSEDSTTSVSCHDASVRRLCCLNLSKAYVMRIMALEIHLTAGNEKARGNEAPSAVLDKLPAGLKNLMSKVNEPAKLSQLRQSFVKNDYNPLVAQKTITDADILLQSIGIYNHTGALLFKLPRIGGNGDEDAAGEPRQYGDSYLYDFRMASTRVRTLFKDITSKYGFLRLDNLIVTPEVQAVLDMKQYCNNALKSILEVNYNASIVDSQIILLRSFKTFIETSSNRVSDLIWANKSTLQGSALLSTFFMGLIKNAQEEQRNDGVSLTSYSVLIQFIRSLTEDWISKNGVVLTGIDAAAKKEFALKTFDLLSALCDLLDRENFAVMNSITDFTAIRFHRPLLESVTLCLRSLGGVVRNLATTDQHMKFQDCLANLLSIVCKSFHVLVIKAGAYSAQGSKVTEEAAESCIKDVTVVVSLLQDLISPKYNLTETVWLNHFITYDTISSLLNLFYGGVEILVKEVDSQTSGNDSTIKSLNITPYAESALYFLLELSNIPRGAQELIHRQIFDSLSNNRLTTRLQEGTLDLFIRFGDATKSGQPAYVERNPLHTIWCQMLAVVNNLDRHCGKSRKVFEKTANFMQVYGPQIGKAFANANGANDTIFGLTASESLSTPLLEEIEHINMIFYGLSKHYQEHAASDPHVDNLFVSFKNCSLLLLQRYLYFFTHPSHMQAQLYPMDNVERHQNQIIVDAEENKSTTASAAATSATATTTETTTTNGPKVKASQFMLKTLRSTLVISHYMITSLIILTEASVVLKELDTKWPFGNTIIYPDMRVTMGETATFGTLIEFIKTGISMMDQWSNNKEYPTSELLDVIQDCSLLLTTQLVLWIAKPDIKEDTRMEIAQDNLTDVVDINSKVEIALKKMSNAAALQSRVKLIQTLQAFLGKRYYGK